MERLWRKRAEYDAKLGKSSTRLSNDISSPALVASANDPSLLPQPPKEAVQIQTEIPLKQEEERWREASPPTAPSRLSSSAASLAKRMVTSATAVSSKSRAAPPSRNSARDATQSQDAAPAIHRSSSITTAAFKYSENSRGEDDVVSGISLMGLQMGSTVRRMNQSAVLQRSRTKGMSEVKAENTMLLIQAVARNDSNTVNSMLQQGLGSIDDTDGSGNSNPPSITTASPPTPPPSPLSQIPAISRAAPNLHISSHCSIMSCRLHEQFQRIASCSISARRSADASQLQRAPAASRGGCSGFSRVRSTYHAPFSTCEKAAWRASAIKCAANRTSHWRGAPNHAMLGRP